MAAPDPRKGASRASIAADVLVEGLARRGVRLLFGMPGSHATTIYDALGRLGTIATVLVRNEQAGAFAADGSARVTGRPGVVCTTAGPGATNALTGLAEAWADSVPLLLLAGQVNADRMHQECGAYHEIDLEGIFRPVTKFCAHRARRRPDPRPPGPRVRGDDRGPPPARRLDPAARPDASGVPGRARRQPHRPLDHPRSRARGPDRRGGRAAVPRRRPIVLAGGGALWAGAEGEVRAVAGRLKAPIITSLNGKGIVDERDPLSLGHARSARAKAALPHADAMLAVGCRFTEVMTDWRRMPVPAALVQIDLDPEQVGMNHPVAVGIVADAKAALRALVHALPADREDGWGALRDRALAARPSGPSG